MWFHKNTWYTPTSETRWVCQWLLGVINNSFDSTQLAPIRLSKYNEDLLFYLYYTSGGDLLQLLAAHEL